jgi:hypothetical protein
MLWLAAERSEVERPCIEELSEAFVCGVPHRGRRARGATSGRILERRQ